MGSSGLSQGDPMAILNLLNPEEPDRRLVSRARSDSASGSRSEREYTRSPESTYSAHSYHSTPAYRETKLYNRRLSSTITYYTHPQPQVRSRASERERREFRPTYQMEEEFFIWYHRVDLNMDWTEVKNAFNRQFPGRQRRGFQGIQCKYYRCAEGHGVPAVRERNKTVAASKLYGVRAKCPHVWYPWMRPEART